MVHELTGTAVQSISHRNPDASKERFATFEEADLGVTFAGSAVDDDGNIAHLLIGAVESSADRTELLAPGRWCRRRAGRIVTFANPAAEEAHTDCPRNRQHPGGTKRLRAFRTSLNLMGAGPKRAAWEESSNRIRTRRAGRRSHSPANEEDVQIGMPAENIGTPVAPAAGSLRVASAVPIGAAPECDPAGYES